jgi:hypothetical protein
MTSWRSAVGVVLVLLVTLVMAGCDNVGVGIGVGYPGSHWGAGATGPGVIVGGPAF